MKRKPFVLFFFLTALTLIYFFSGYILKSFVFAEEKKIQVESLPDAIKIQWSDDARFKKSIVVRSENNIPKNINDGKIVYEGSGNFFLDSDIEVGKTYYYSVISVKNKFYIETIKTVTKKTAEIFSKIPSPAKTTMVVAGSGAQIVSFFSVFDSLKDLGLSLLRIFQITLPLLIFGKRKKWGIVYDWETKEPLKNLPIGLFNEKGEKIDSILSDEAGRFGFLVKKGIYTVVPYGNKKYIAKPEEYQNKDIYGDVYRGTEIRFEADSDVIELNIPLSRINKEKKVHRNIFRFFSLLKSSKIASIFLEALFLLGFVTVLLSLARKITPLLIVIVVFYLIIIILRLIMFFTTKDFGLVLDIEKKTVVPFAVVRVFKDKKTEEEQLGVAVSNTKGSFYLLVPKEADKFSIKGRTLEGRTFKKELPANPKLEVMNQSYYV